MQRQVEDAAAVVLQSSARGLMVRVSMRDMNEAAVAIQAAARDRQLRKRNHAALRMQCMIRGSMTRYRIRTERMQLDADMMNAATNIQRVVRGRQSREDISRMQRACSVIVSNMRGYCLRRGVGRDGNRYQKLVLRSRALKQSEERNAVSSARESAARLIQRCASSAGVCPQLSLSHHLSPTFSPPPEGVYEAPSVRTTLGGSACSRTAGRPSLSSLETTFTGRRAGRTRRRRRAELRTVTVMSVCVTGV
jgi:hypothetical protein